MNNGISIGKVWGIPLRLHISWFIIFFLVAWSLAVGYLPSETPGLSRTMYWILGVTTSLLFAASVMAHELGHSYVALRNKVPVKSVTLFIFGGIAQIEQEPKTPKAEFWIAIAGPAVSLALGLLFGAIWLALRPLEAVSVPGQWLARINLLLAAFNLIPGFPLDGGRVLRSILWRFNRSLQKATRITATIGQIVAFGFIIYGVFALFSGNFFNGLWLAFIGWFLQNAAASSVGQTTLTEILRGVPVSAVMKKDIPSVPWFKKLDCVIEEDVLPTGWRIFRVTDGNDMSLRGLLTLRSVTAVPRERWPDLTAQEVMIPRSQFVTVTPDMEMLDALRVMDDANIAQAPVIDQDEMIGILTREDLTHYIRLRAEIGV
ncbi:MAG: site-2 protease family protein [Anaerolineaceae bacterium]